MKEKAILIGVGLKSDSFVELKESLAELEELSYAAGADVVGTLVQVLPQYTSATLMGSGKVIELRDLAKETEAGLVIIDHHLSGIQTRNLETELGVRVLDRSQLILDIFAQRAQTYEGKLQVELAQMLDQLPRMVGAWKGSLSRQAGGIGTRGPGESALEIDRRRINDKVKLIRKKLDSVSKRREQHRSKRKRQQVPSFALIGYTNSGKSTLLNQLSNSNVLAKNQMFATLDPSTRKVFLPDIAQAVVTDTVGLIRKLPTQLIEAFKATLEESSEADVLLHVIDLSSDQMKAQIEVVDKLMEDLGWTDKPIIYIFNKIDLASPEKQFQIDQFPKVLISAHTGEHIGKLKAMMTQTLQSLHNEVELFFAKVDEYKIFELSRQTEITRKEVNVRGTVCYANLTPTQLSEWSEFLTSNS